ncbi:MAG: DMT family transporter [Pseudomonadota bacterium]
MPASQSSSLRAALWMTGAVASFSLMAIGGREVSHRLDTFELMFFRSMIGLVLVLAYGAAVGCFAQVKTQRFGLHAVRNLFHFTAQNLWFYALPFIPLSQLFAIEFTTPIWIALLAPLLLAEKFTYWRVIAAALGFAGILVIARPGLAPLNVGHLTAALSTIGFCGSIMMTKALSRTEKTWTILFWLTAIQSVYGAIAVAWDGDMTLPDAETWYWVVLVGICGLTAHLSLTNALGLAPASIVAPMDFSRLPVIAIVAWLVYSEPLEIAVAVGAALILFANVLNLRAENARAKVPETA